MTKELTTAQKRELAKLLEEKERRIRYSRIDQLFPETGPYRRELYPKHMAFMKAGKKYRQRAIIAANRTGKTLMGAYEMTCHLTGRYPDWWEGRVFTQPIEAWAASIRNEDTKNIVQKELLGDPLDIGSGLIKKEYLYGKPVRKPGVVNSIETIYVKHISGGLSRLDFKAYEQGRDAFQGTKKQVIWLDEEPRDYEIYTECLTRTMDDRNPGLIYCTFTPLLGLSETVLSFLPDGKIPENNVHPDNPYKYVTQVSWEEVPHLNDDQKKEMLQAYLPHERDARSKGYPAMGSGAIYPYMEDELVVEPFPIPCWWPRACGLDVGWNKTAAVWGALDPDSKQIYLYSEHYMGKEVPAVHASAIKLRGDWIPVAIDPRADARSTADGTRIIDLYEAEGLFLNPADNAVDAGIYKINQLFASNQLKIFTPLKNLLAELRVYRRDKDGKVVKKNDHMMDAMRYLIMTGMEHSIALSDTEYSPEDYSTGSTGRSEVTGY